MNIERDKRRKEDDAWAVAKEIILTDEDYVICDEKTLSEAALNLASLYKYALLARNGKIDELKALKEEHQQRF